MGLGQLARSTKPLHAVSGEPRVIPKTQRKVWAFLGDGETDEPESLGALTLASREKLDI